MQESLINRRHCLAALVGGATAMLTLPRGASAREVELPPVRTITRGPRHHWFGYYDKHEFDPTGRYVLGMAVDFEDRVATADDTIEIGMVDLADGDRWIKLGTSSTFSWQQGCMLQWLPGADNKVLWNDRQGDQFVCRILDVGSRDERILPRAIYTLSPDGATAVAADFRRLAHLRPECGYAGVEDPFAEQLAPARSGIWRINLASGEEQLIFSLAAAAKFGNTTDEMRGAKHFIQHLAFNADGSRISFLHRWRHKDAMFHTRMITANPDGSDPFVLDPSGATSHYCWRDAEHLLVYTRCEGPNRRFYVMRDKSTHFEPIGKDVMTENGHCTYLPGNEWILNDTYPDNKRLQHVYLYHVASGRRVPLGSFYSPKQYSGVIRCDTHPRFSRDGRMVMFDSPHTGEGRQMHLIDISSIVA